MSSHQQCQYPLTKKDQRKMRPIKAEDKDEQDLKCKSKAQAWGSKMLHASLRSDYGSNRALMGSGGGSTNDVAFQLRIRWLDAPFLPQKGSGKGSKMIRTALRDQMLRHASKMEHSFSKSDASEGTSTGSGGVSKMMHPALRDEMLRHASCAAGNNQPTNSMPIISPTDAWD